MKEEIKKLTEQLKNSGIDVSRYGKGKSKKIEDLFKEIKDNETVLINEDGKLLRKSQIVNVEILYKDKEGNKFVLREQKQIFNDGRERKRDHLLGSLSGKMKVNENPKESIIREIQEELGISGQIDVLDNGYDEETIKSQSYPGLLTNYVTYRFVANLLDKDFKSDGYIEKTDSLTTYFVWEKIKS